MNPQIHIEEVGGEVTLVVKQHVQGSEMMFRIGGWQTGDLERFELQLNDLLNKLSDAE